MSDLFNYLDNSVRHPRYSDAQAIKQSGAIYTPQKLAAFVANQILRVAEFPIEGKIRVLDPAVGDGALLDALINALSADVRERLEVVGYDTDPDALKISRQRFEKNFPNINMNFNQQDFLNHVINLQPQGGGLFKNELHEKFDLVIANPPYVRTQVLGADRSRQIAQNFGLTGRVDLYYPFLIGISQVLNSTGVAGIITSNRYMTTKSGQTVRRELLTRFRILHAWDLGDSKLFDAAVLPMVLLAKGTSDWQQPHATGVRLSSIYQTDVPAKIQAEDVLVALSADNEATVGVPDGRSFHVRHGVLDNGGNAEGTWRIATATTDQWLATVESHTWNTFGKIGKIRVGVKSTADKVFIRSDWDQLPGGCPELLRPLITRSCGRQFKSIIPSGAKDIKKILYPHEIRNGMRIPVDLAFYPNAARYLEKHRATLERRKYLIEAGRRWYELWVPQDPDAWSRPKLVFLDISTKPTFWIDLDGGVVNGECYWLQCDSKHESDLLWLALAVANSTLIEVFYDHRFNNKLYSGRRRYITQYVEQFPLPDPEKEDAQAIIALTKQIHAEISHADINSKIADLDRMVWEIFGLGVEKVLR